MLINSINSNKFYQILHSAINTTESKQQETDPTWIQQVLLLSRYCYHYLIVCAILVPSLMSGGLQPASS